MLACVSNKLQLLANFPVFHGDFQGGNTDKEFKQLAPPQAAITPESEHRATAKKTKCWKKNGAAEAETATDRGPGADQCARCAG